MAAAARLGWNPYLHNPKLRKRLPSIKVPTLVVRAERDTLIPEPHAQTYVAEIPSAKLVKAPDVAHMISIERPNSPAVVSDFLSCVPQPS
jgi:pimeloyl-ACP methyl ester carboxylesterase